MHFCNLRGVHPDPELFLDKTKIEVVPEFKFLGIIFDNKLSFLSHVTVLKNKCKKALNLLKVVAHSDWGADRKVLIRLYRSLIRSKLDYGSIVYGSAQKLYFEFLILSTMKVYVLHLELLELIQLIVSMLRLMNLLCRAGEKSFPFHTF